MVVMNNPDPKTQSILNLSFVGAAFKGDGDTNFNCGSCGTTLLEKVGKSQFSNIIIRCGKCQTYNALPATNLN